MINIENIQKFFTINGISNGDILSIDFDKTITKKHIRKEPIELFYNGELHRIDFYKNFVHVYKDKNDAKKVHALTPEIVKYESVMNILEYYNKQKRKIIIDIFGGMNRISFWKEFIKYATQNNIKIIVNSANYKQNVASLIRLAGLQIKTENICEMNEMKIESKFDRIKGLISPVYKLFHIDDSIEEVDRFNIDCNKLNAKAILFEESLTGDNNDVIFFK